jgi:integrase
LGLDEFFAWFSREPRPGAFTKETVAAWRVALEARGLGAVSINVRITAVRKLAVEAADNGLLAPDLASGITRVKGVASKGVRLGNWLTVKQAQMLLNTPDASTTKGLRGRAILAVLLGCRLRRSECTHVRSRPAAGRAVVHRRPSRPFGAPLTGSDHWQRGPFWRCHNGPFARRHQHFATEFAWVGPTRVALSATGTYRP